MKDYRSLETKIRAVLEATATQLRRKVVNVARPDSAKPTDEKSPLAKQAEIKNKIIDEEQATEVITDPKTDDKRVDDTTKAESVAKKNPIATNLNKFNKPSVVKDKKKEVKKGYMKHKDKIAEEQTTMGKLLTPAGWRASLEKTEEPVQEAKEHTVPKTEKEKKLAALAEPRDKITHKDILVGRGAVKEDKVEEATGVAPKAVNPHNCATHVFHEQFGEGRTLTTQHADPDSEGNIAWYDVMFEHGIEKQVSVQEMKIVASESHMHARKKMKEEVEIIENLDTWAAKHEKAGCTIKKDIKSGTYHAWDGTKLVSSYATHGKNTGPSDTNEEVEIDEATYSAKAARAGKDIGKPGKQFAKIAKSAAKRYDSKEAGERVAGAILKKLRAKRG